MPPIVAQPHGPAGVALQPPGVAQLVSAMGPGAAHAPAPAASAPPSAGPAAAALASAAPATAAVRAAPAAGPAAATAAGGMKTSRNGSSGGGGGVWRAACWHYNRGYGYCRLGDNCKFSHAHD